VRYRLMATYRGAPYEAGIGPTERDVVLFAACPPPEELNFEPATGHWRKQLRVEEVQALWESRPVGLFRGERCVVLDDIGERLHIAYLGHDAYQAERLGYWQVDRGVFELITPRDEVTDIVEERREYDYPLPARPVAPADVTTGPLRALGPLPVPTPGFAPDPVPARNSGFMSAPAPVADGLLPSPAYAPGPPPGPDADPGWEFRPPAAPPEYVRQPEDSGVRLPPVHPAPLPVEAAALRAAARAATMPSARPAAAALPAPGQPADPVRPGPQPGRRRGARRRRPAARIFSELADMAAIPATAYSIGAEADGAICLVPAAGGFEVFSSSAGVRHEVRLFADEESAYFYMFGLLAAEAVQTGVLAPRG
jgi:hypothetical protein